MCGPCMDSDYSDEVSQVHNSGSDVNNGFLLSGFSVKALLGKVSAQ